MDRSVSESGSFDTGSDITYGYGDTFVTWTTGSFKAMVENVRETDVIIEPGFWLDDYKRIYIDPDETVAELDQCLYPSGSGIRYVIRSVEDYRMGNTVVSKMALIRRLMPRSGSVY